MKKRSSKAGRMHLPKASILLIPVILVVIVSLIFAPAAYAAWVAQIVDGDGGDNVGQYSSLVVANGNPAIAYFNQTQSKLQYVRALDGSGTTWGTPVTVDNTVGSGLDISMAIVNGRPAISYRTTDTGGHLKYVRAADADGASWGTPVTVADGSTLSYTSLAVVSGNPAISYYSPAGIDGYLKYVRATDIDGTTWGLPVTVDGAGGENVGQHTSLKMVNGSPAISYYDFGNGNLKYVRAADSTGAAWNTPQTLVDSTDYVGEYTSLEVVNGNPAIGYNNITQGSLNYIRAADADGNTWNAEQVLDDPVAQSVGKHCSLAVINGNPAISYYDQSNSALKYIRANDANGNNWGTPETVDNGGWVGTDISLILVNGSPAVSYYEGFTEGNLRYARDDTPPLPTSTSTTTGTATVTGTATGTGTITPTKTGTLEATSTPTATDPATPTSTVTTTGTPEASVTVTLTPDRTATATLTETVEPSATPSLTATGQVQASATPSATAQPGGHLYLPLVRR